MYAPYPSVPDAQAGTTRIDNTYGEPRKDAS